MQSRLLLSFSAACILVGSQALKLNSAEVSTSSSDVTPLDYNNMYDSRNVTNLMSLFAPKPKKAMKTVKNEVREVLKPS